MALTYEPIATTTASGSSNSITFNSISSAYTDLKLIVVGTTLSSAGSVRYQVNNDSGTNYSRTTIYGDGTTAASNTGTNQTYFDFNSQSFQTSTPKFNTLDFFSYAGTTNKTVLFTESGDLNGSGYVTLSVGLWRSTSAINSITIYTAAGQNFSSTSTFTLYGIKAA